MIKKLLIATILLIFINCEAQDKVTFSPQALQDTFLPLKGGPVTFKEILEAHKGKTILIDIWAGWCRDCIVGMPIVKELQKDHPDVVFVFLSIDKDLPSWKNSIKRFGIENGEHYFSTGGWNSPFNKSIDLDWVPRYIIVNPEGKMSLFKATKASDLHIKKTLTAS